MTNEMKLLMTLCESLGFEVETIIDRKERQEDPEHAMKYNSCRPTERRLKAEGATCELIRDEKGNYTSYLVEPIISYKLNKINKGG
jgi:hypothetical protein